MIIGKLHRHRELTELWTESRQVLRLFRDNVEYLFRFKYLRKTSIHFDLSKYELCPRENF